MEQVAGGGARHGHHGTQGRGAVLVGLAQAIEAGAGQGRTVVRHVVDHDLAVPGARGVEHGFERRGVAAALHGEVVVAGLRGGGPLQQHGRPIVAGGESEQFHRQDDAAQEHPAEQVVGRVVGRAGGLVAGHRGAGEVGGVARVAIVEVEQPAGMPQGADAQTVDAAAVHVLCIGPVAHAMEVAAVRPPRLHRVTGVAHADAGPDAGAIGARGIGAAGDGIGQGGAALQGGMADGQHVHGIGRGGIGGVVRWQVRVRRGVVVDHDERAGGYGGPLRDGGEAQVARAHPAAHHLGAEAVEDRPVVVVDDPVAQVDGGAGRPANKELHVLLLAGGSVARLVHQGADAIRGVGHGKLHVVDGHAGVRSARIVVVLPAEADAHGGVVVRAGGQCDAVVGPSALVAAARRGGLRRVAQCAPGRAVPILEQEVVRGALPVLHVLEAERDVAVAAEVDHGRLGAFVRLGAQASAEAEGAQAGRATGIVRGPAIARGAEDASGRAAAHGGQLVGDVQGGIVRGAVGPAGPRRVPVLAATDEPAVGAGPLGTDVGHGPGTVDAGMGRSVAALGAAVLEGLGPDHQLGRCAPAHGHQDQCHAQAGDAPGRVVPVGHVPLRTGHGTGRLSVGKGATGHHGGP